MNASNRKAAACVCSQCCIEPGSLLMGQLYESSEGDHRLPASGRLALWLRQGKRSRCAVKYKSRLGRSALIGGEEVKSDVAHTQMRVAVATPHFQPDEFGLLPQKFALCPKAGGHEKASSPNVHACGRANTTTVSGEYADENSRYRIPQCASAPDHHSGNALVTPTGQEIRSGANQPHDFLRDRST